MAFCQFDDSAALFDSTPVENMFITEYMLRAPGDFVKVYIYGLMLCYHASPRMSLASMARDLDMTEEDVERAFKYWSRDGLVRRTGDNPVTYAFCNLKQLTLTKAQSPGEQLYNKHFMDEVERILGGRTLTPAEHQIIFDWIDVLELPEDVVLVLLQNEMKKSNGRVSISIADKTAQQWAQNGVKTVEDAEKIEILGREREQQLRRLLARLGQARTPSDDQKKLYSYWIDEWGFTYEEIQDACSATTGGIPSMNYLDAILRRKYQIKEKGIDLKVNEEVFQFVRGILAVLGHTGITPSEEDQKKVTQLLEDGFSKELILHAAKMVHEDKHGGNLELVEKRLHKWKQNKLNTVEEVEAVKLKVEMQNEQLRQIYKASGYKGRVNAEDRDMMVNWLGQMSFSMEMVLLAAEYATGSVRPMKVMNKILSDWQRAGISSVEAAKAEHETHVQGARSAAPRAAANVRAQDVLQRHTYTQEDFSRMVVDLDEEES